MKIEIPKDIDAESKILFVSIKRIITAVIMIFILSQLSILVPEPFMFMYKILGFIFVVYLQIRTVYSSKRSNFDLLRNQLIYYYDYMKSKGSYINYDYREELIKKKKRTKKVRFETTKLEKRDKYFEKLNIKEFVIDSNFNYIIQKDNTYTTFLRLEINELPTNQSDEVRIGAMNELHELLLKVENGRIRLLNSPLNLDDFINELVVKKTDSIYEEIFDMKIEQLVNAKQRTEKIFIIELKANDLKSLDDKVKLTCRNYNNFKVNVVDDQTFKKINYQIFLDNFNATIHSNSIEINNKYKRYLCVTDFETKQYYYYLLKIFGCNCNVSLDIRKIDKIKAELKLNNSYAEIDTRLKWHRTPTAQIDAQQTKARLRQITEDITIDAQALFQVEVIIEVTANTMEELDFKTKQVKEELKLSCKVTSLAFEQQRLFENYMLITSSQLINKVIPSKILSEGYPFNYMTLIQKDGFIKNNTSESLIILDRYNIDSSLGQNSYDKLVIGYKGSGKSFDLKAEACEELIIGNTVWMWDFDAENVKMCNHFKGTNVQIGDLKNSINILDVTGYGKNNILNSHISHVVEFLNILGNFNKLETIYLKQKLKQVYDAYSIPTLNDLYTVISAEYKLTTMENIEEYNKLKNVLDILGEIIDSYPFYAQHTQVDLNNQLINFSLNEIKDEKRLLEATMYWLVKLSNQKMRNNKLYTSMYRTQKEKIDYLKSEFRNHKLDEQLLNQLNNETRPEVVIQQLENIINDNRAKFRMIIDEAHRVLDNDFLRNFIIKVIREARKYNSGMTLATHNAKEFFGKLNSNDLETMWSLLDYKLFMAQQKSSVDFLQELVGLTNEQAKKILSFNHKGQGLLQIGNKFYNYHSPLSKKWEYIFDGGR